MNFVAPTEISVTNEWESISEDWPLDDYWDTKDNVKTQFYYLKNKSESIEWKLKDEFIKKIKEESQFFKLSFKV